MRNLHVQNQIQEISALIEEIDAVDMLQVHWGRYLCVTVAAFLENALRETYTEYAYQAVTDSKIGDYVSNQIGYTIGNPNTENLRRATKSFSEEWEQELTSFISVNGRGEAVNAIMRHRNDIAHGRQSTISPQQVRQHLQRCVEIVDFIENQCLNALKTSQSPD